MFLLPYSEAILMAGCECCGEHHGFKLLCRTSSLEVPTLPLRTALNGLPQAAPLPVRTELLQWRWLQSQK